VSPPPNPCQKKDKCALERQLQAAPLPTRAPASLINAPELAIAAAIQATLGGQGGAPRLLARRPADFNVAALVQIFLVPDEVPTAETWFLDNISPIDL
jgi:hypothetical protein